VSVAGNATLDGKSWYTIFKQTWLAVVKSFTGNRTARTKTWPDPDGGTAFTQTYTDDGNNSRTTT
jgi:hypothetical protein